MWPTSCVVDGQQRLSAIAGFLRDEFEVGGKKFTNLSITEKENFLKYQIAVIELDLAEDDPTLIDIFKRLNRTFYSLSTIEKYSTEFSSSEFMIVAKVLCNEINADADVENDGAAIRLDPNIPQDSIDWAKGIDPKCYRKLVLGGGIFSPYETSRMVHLMFTLNVVATKIGGFYNRNDKAKEYLDQYSQEFSDRTILVNQLNSAAEFILSLKLDEQSYWLNKANIFSLLILALSYADECKDIGHATVNQKLKQLHKKLPKEYADAAKEGVNNKKERTARHRILAKAILNIDV